MVGLTGNSHLAQVVAPNQKDGGRKGEADEEGTNGNMVLEGDDSGSGCGEESRAGRVVMALPSRRVAALPQGC